MAHYKSLRDNIPGQKSKGAVRLAKSYVNAVGCSSSGTTDSQLCRAIRYRRRVRLTPMPPMPIPSVVVSLMKEMQLILIALFMLSSQFLALFGI